MNASDLCQSFARDLVANRPIGTIAGPIASAFRHTLRIHGLSGIAVRAIDAGSLSLEGRVADGIRSDWHAATAWSFLVDGECKRVSEAGRHCSTPILLKGRSVADRYVEPELRTYYDIDFLVPPDEIREWAGLLHGLGYTGPYNHLGTTERQHQESVTFTRGDSPHVSIDLHACLHIAPTARHLSYAFFLPYTEPTAIGNVSQLAPTAQMLTLALHFVHHTPNERRLVWIRDLLELPAPVIAEARAMAVINRITWAVEEYLLAAQKVLGEDVWGIRPPSNATRFTTTSPAQGVLLRNLAHARVLGPINGLRYLASRVDPRRFCEPGTRINYSSAVRWIDFTKASLRKSVWRPPMSDSSVQSRRLDL